MKLLTSTLIWLTLWLPMFVLSLIVTPLMCLTKWEGKTTWFGNFKYGRGDTHYKAPSNGEYWKQILFLVIRNPISNFGKGPLSVKAADWVWMHDVGYKRVHILYGWKNPSGEMPDRRTFVWRPYFLRNRSPFAEQS